MGAQLISAVLGAAALAYSLGSLLRAHLRESRSEREIAARAKRLDEQYDRLFDASTIPYSSGMMAEAPRDVDISVQFALSRHREELERFRADYARALASFYAHPESADPSDVADDERVERVLKALRDKEGERHPAAR